MQTSTLTFTCTSVRCRFRFLVDGTRVLADFELDDISARSLAGIEIYAGLAQVPAQFRALSGSSVGPTCGVIALWTRDGR